MLIIAKHLKQHIETLFFSLIIYGGFNFTNDNTIFIVVNKLLAFINVVNKQNGIFLNVYPI